MPYLGHMQQIVDVNLFSQNAIIIIEVLNISLWMFQEVAKLKSKKKEKKKQKKKQKKEKTHKKNKKKCDSSDSVSQTQRSHFLFPVTTSHICESLSNGDLIILNTIFVLYLKESETEATWVEKTVAPSSIQGPKLEVSSENVAGKRKRKYQALQK